MKKKIMVLSVASWNSMVGADTWPMFMNQYDSDSIASLSLRDDYPDSNASKHYFVISENRVIKSIFNHKIKTGHIIEGTQTKQEKDDLASQKRRYSVQKHEVFFRILREFVWVLGSWKSKELNEFIDDFQPDIILYAMEGYIHFNRICRYVKKYSHAKSIGFFCDDNFTYKQSSDVSHQIFRFFQRNSIKRLVNNTDAFWAISNMTKREAEAHFNINCTVLTKPIRELPIYKETVFHKPLKIIYTGNLQIGRETSLIKVVNALKIVNQRQIEFELDVYTKTKLDSKVMRQLTNDYCHIYEAIPQEKVFDLQKKADILLFLEDVDGKYAHKARLSFSTKITDYLCAAKCILAIGCLDTAPMQYFMENKVAMIATNVDEIVKKLTLLIECPDLMNSYANNACKCAIQNHDKENINNIIDTTIDAVLSAN